jgi:D-beta-D-heptose 7-phosphate kinase/D-beta-D-heptose 1-phosphate adenosyltransferase
VIVSTAELAQHRRAVTMVDGGFDPLHAGHVAYFEAAAGLGLPVLCNVSGDDWVARKHRPLLPQAERARVIDAIRWIDLVHLSSGPTVDVLAALEPRYYAKGADWKGRLPAEEAALCAERGIQIVYLDTVLDSSTAILDRYGDGRPHD